jgi:hypothetical protein
MMAQCITCGTTLHPERARKYNYCMARDCQEKNATGLTMVAVGMNKAADELMILDERTRADLAAGKYRDQRRGSFGPPASGPRAAPGVAGASGPTRPQRAPRPAPAPVRRPWSRRQEKLALLYNERGLRPAEIADKLGVSAYTVTQIILDARNRAKG